MAVKNPTWMDRARKWLGITEGDTDSTMTLPESPSDSHPRFFLPGGPDIDPHFALPGGPETDRHFKLPLDPDPGITPKMPLRPKGPHFDPDPGIVPPGSRKPESLPDIITMPDDARPRKPKWWEKLPGLKPKADDISDADAERVEGDLTKRADELASKGDKSLKNKLTVYEDAENAMAAFKEQLKKDGKTKDRKFNVDELSKADRKKYDELQADIEDSRELLTREAKRKIPEMKDEFLAKAVEEHARKIDKSGITVEGDLRITLENPKYMEAMELAYMKAKPATPVKPDAEFNAGKKPDGVVPEGAQTQIALVTDPTAKVIKL